MREGKLGYDTSEWISVPETEQTEYLARVRAASDEANILCAVGEHLPEILRKEVEPFSLMLEDQRLDKYYANNSRMIRSVDQTFSYIGFLAHKNPHLNVLEIGAGTGGATLPALKALGGMDGSLPQFSNYDFTDISAGFFEKARQKLDAWGDLVTYRKLDIEVDPIKQGFEEESYDLILASNVLHATSQMKRTMTHVRKLLKPGGKLLLIELVQEKLTTTAVFGTLPGWWIGKPLRPVAMPALTSVRYRRRSNEWADVDRGQVGCSSEGNWIFWPQIGSLGHAFCPRPSKLGDDCRSANRSTKVPEGGNNSRGR